MDGSNNGNDLTIMMALKAKLPLMMRTMAMMMEVA